MPENNFYKGNIHTHTTESDGDTDPKSVVRWYRQHGYDFLVLSDHNHRTILEYSDRERRFKKPLMIPGEEVSVRTGNGTIPIHINGIGISRLVEPIDAEGIVPTIQANVNAILEAGGIASINHPNSGWAFDHKSISQVNGAHLLEVYNGNPNSNVEGAPGKFSYEEIWDGVLSSRKVIFGAATDDSHKFQNFDPKLSNPGRGWIVAQSSELSINSILNALSSGNFYSSTGVTLSKLHVSKGTISLSIESEHDYVYTTKFTGRHGIILAEVVGMEAEYNLRGNEGYVRTTVNSSGNHKAWIQPIFTK